MASGPRKPSHTSLRPSISTPYPRYNPWMILQLNPTIRVLTPLGEAIAFFIQEQGQEIYFGVFQLATGENWWFENDKVRLMPCLSEGLHSTSSITPMSGLEKHRKRHERT